VSGEGNLDLARRFVGAIERGDIEGVKACYAPDARIWHNNDQLEQTVGENLRVLGWVIRNLRSRRYRIVRLEALGDGYLQQHVLEATLPDGSAFAMPACLIVRTREGRITRLDEYLDSAQTAPLLALSA